MNTFLWMERTSQMQGHGFVDQQDATASSDGLFLAPANLADDAEDAFATIKSEFRDELPDLHSLPLVEAGTWTLNLPLRGHHDSQPSGLPAYSSYPATASAVQGGEVTPARTYRVRDEHGEDAPTVCFTDKHRDAPLQHVLMCGHTITTPLPEPCHKNCKLSNFAESKPGKPGSHHRCFPACEKKQNSVFVGRRNQAGIRKSTVPGPKKNRELARLITESYAGQQAILTTTRVRRAPLDLVDPTADLRDTRARPHCYGINQGTLRNLRQRPEFSGMTSFPEDAYESTVRAENGIVDGVEDAEVAARSRFRQNQDDADFDGPVHQFNARDAQYCVCQQVADGNMVECVDCQRMFHSGCVGKGQSAANLYQGENRTDCQRLDRDHFASSGIDFRCGGCETKSKSATKMLGGQNAIAAIKKQSAVAARAKRQEKAKYRISKPTPGKRSRAPKSKQDTVVLVFLAEGATINDLTVAERQSKVYTGQICEKCKERIIGFGFRCTQCEEASLCENCTHDKDRVDHTLQIFTVDIYPAATGPGPQMAAPVAKMSANAMDVDMAGVDNTSANPKQSRTRVATTAKAARGGPKPQQASRIATPRKAAASKLGEQR